MDRLFLDANVLFSAAYRADSGLQRLWALPAVQLVTSDYAVEEAERNLETAEQLDRLTDLLKKIQVVAPSSALVEGIDLPAKDLPIVAGALAAQATHLLTGDVRHFGRFFGRRLAGIRILRPAQYLASYDTSMG